MNASSRRSDRQRGMSGAGWFMVIILLFGAASIAVRMIPHYIDHNTIDGQILSLLEKPDLAGMSVAKIHSALKQQLKLNNIRDFETRDALEIEKGAGTIEMDLLYEVREKLFWNVDVVLTFQEHYEKVL